MNEKGFRVYATVLNTESEGAKKLKVESRFDSMTHVLRMDVTKDDQVMNIFKLIEADLKDKREDLWAVVNNAGITAWGPIDWGTMKTYSDVHEVNTFGLVRVTRNFLPLIRKSKGMIAFALRLDKVFIYKYKNIT